MAFNVLVVSKLAEQSVFLQDSIAEELNTFTPLQPCNHGAIAVVKK